MEVLGWELQGRSFEGGEMSGHGGGRAPVAVLDGDDGVGGEAQEPVE